MQISHENYLNPLPRKCPRWPIDLAQALISQDPPCLSTMKLGSKLPTHYLSWHPCHQPGTADLCLAFTKLKVKCRGTGVQGYRLPSFISFASTKSFLPQFLPQPWKLRVASNGLTQLSMPHLWRQTKAWSIKMACQWAGAVYTVNWTH